MSDPNVAPFTFVEAYDIFDKLYNSVDGYQEKRTYNFVPRRFVVNICYFNELIFPVADPDIREVFLTTRKFLQNDSDDVVTVVGDFVPWDFQPRIVYCCSNLELGYFLGKAKQLGLPLIEDTYEGWLDQGDPPMSFFWS